MVNCALMWRRVVDQVTLNPDEAPARVHAHGHVGRPFAAETRPDPLRGPTPYGSSASSR